MDWPGEGSSSSLASLDDDAQELLREELLSRSSRNSSRHSSASDLLSIDEDECVSNPMLGIPEAGMKRTVSNSGLDTGFKMPPDQRGKDQVRLDSLPGWSGGAGRTGSLDTYNLRATQTLELGLAISWTNWALKSRISSRACAHVPATHSLRNPATLQPCNHRRRPVAVSFPSRNIPLLCGWIAIPTLCGVVFTSWSWPQRHP